jgi:hypothetical protein
MKTTLFISIFFQVGLLYSSKAQAHRQVKLDSIAPEISKVSQPLDSIPPQNITTTTGDVKRKVRVVYNATLDLSKNNTIAPFTEAKKITLCP